MKLLGVRAPLLFGYKVKLRTSVIQIGDKDEERIARRDKTDPGRGRANFNSISRQNRQTNIPFLIYSKSIAFRWTRVQKSLEFLPSLGSGFGFS
jgi:hypothetical protein